MYAELCSKNLHDVVVSFDFLMTCEDRNILVRYPTKIHDHRDTSRMQFKKLF